MTHLRRYLEQHGTLASDQLDAALRRQQIYGGSLDTVLLELEIIDPRTLNDLLAEACGLPAASPELLEASGSRPWDAIPSDLVEIGWAVPLVRTGSTIVVAVHPDLPNERLGALYRLTPVVTPVVTPECCVEKIAAERAPRVVPQRYAVLFASYLGALRPRSPAAGQRRLTFDALPGLGLTEDTQTGPPLPSLAELDAARARTRREASPPGSPRRFRPPGAPVDALATVHVTPPPPVPDDSAAGLANGRAIAVHDDDDDALPPGYFTRDREIPGELTHGPNGTSAHTTDFVDAEDDDGIPITPVNDDVSPPAWTRVPETPRSTAARTPDVERVDGDDELPAGVPSFLAEANSRGLTVSPASEDEDAQLEAFDALPPPRETAQRDAFSPARDDARPVTLSPGGTTFAIPPVRFPPRTPVLTATERLQARQGETRAAERRSASQEDLLLASTRDEVMRALVRAAILTTPRVALFRVREDALQGLPTPGSALPDFDRITISLPPGSPMVAAIQQHRYHGPNADPGLLAALEVEQPVPCVTCRIDIADKPVLLLYADHGGREFLPGEIAELEDLARDASASLRRVLEAKAGTRTPQTEADGIGVEPDASASSSMLAMLAPPPAFGVTGPPGWGPAPPPLEQSLREEDVRTQPRLPPSPAPSLGRATRIYGSSLTPGPSAIAHRKTVNLTPPPPPLPPPPPMARVRTVEPEPARASSTGIPIAVGPSGSGPRFIPPPLDERENSGIISLASPIEEPSARGRIALDDEDWAPLSGGLANEAELRRIDAALLAFARGEEDLDTIRGFGEAGLARLAAQFPGPLEVLRRDLRALPPPSAHGPHLRAAIQLGSELVPFLLPLFTHADPDVRFYAAFVFQELRDRACMEPLSRLAFDGSGDVRVIAMRVLETYARSEGFAAAAASVREELGSSNRTRQLYAARAVGTLRDVHAIEQLIELLASKDRFIQEAALESLCSITGQQHGLKPHRWKSWHAENGHRHRVEWIIESLRHRDLPVRRWAQDELVRVTGHRIPFSPQGDRNAREVAVRTWTDWWSSTGRQRFLPHPSEEYAG